jgi:carbon storage regulator
MLVLSRKLGQKLLFGSDIVITVLEVRGNGVRLGIEAPGQVEVVRAELAAASSTVSQPCALPLPLAPEQG